MPFDGVMKVSKVTTALIAARDRLEEGWSQYHGRDRGGVCLAIALCDAAHSVDADVLSVIGIVKQAIHNEGGGLAIWNATHTKEEVIDACNQAINLSLDVYALAA